MLSNNKSTQTEQTGGDSYHCTTA